VPRTTNGILQEISNYVPERNKDDVIAMRAQHAIASAIFIFEMIDETHNKQDAEQLKRRFLSSIKAADPAKFARSAKKIKEGKED